MTTQYIFLMVEAILLGLVIGSFLNVCIYRLPKNKTLMGRSFCPQCKTTIPFYRNIPLLSYLLQGGKSACCKKPISIQYPLVEAITAVVSLVTFLQSSTLMEYAIWFCLFMSPLIVVSVVDFQLKIIPDQISIPFIFVGVAVQIYQSYPNFYDAFITSGLGILVGGGSLLILGELMSRIKKRDAMGGGDIKLAAMLGAFLGWRAIIFVFFFSSVIALFYIVIILLLKKQDEDKTIPFGPFLSMAAMVAWLYGKMITDWYFLEIAKMPINVIFP